jgi:hypothetical protein
MYCTNSKSTGLGSSLFRVVREKKSIPQQMEEEEDDEEEVMVKPKRVKQRLPGVKLLRKLAKTRMG